MTDTVIKELNEMAAKGPKSISLDVNPTLVQTIKGAPNDAVAIVQMGRIIYSLTEIQFFAMVYEQFLLGEMVERPWVDSENVHRGIKIIQMDGGPVVADGMLLIPSHIWENRSLQSDNIKTFLGRYLAGRPLNGKQSNGKEKHCTLKLRQEFTAFSNMMNSQVYSFNDGAIRACALRIVDIVSNFGQLITQGTLLDPADVPNMFSAAVDAFYETLDEPSDYGMISAANAAALAGLFMDQRAVKIGKMAVSIIAMKEQIPDDGQRRFEFMASAATLVQF